jgi:PPOX class probable F420-dependent enzyme
LTDDEASEFLAASHTGILSTLHRDGSPALTPMWFIVHYGDVYVRTLARSRKAEHIRRDPRVSFLVERGMGWAELKAMVLRGTMAAEQDSAVVSAVDAAFDAKYAAFLMPESTPAATRAHYAAERVHLKLTVTQRRTWDNAKLIGTTPAAKPPQTAQRLAKLT